MSPDRIEKKVMLRAPVARVWRALTNSAEFEQWFGVRLNGEFAVGQPVTGSFVGTLDEAVIVEHQRRMGLAPAPIRRPGDGFAFCVVERIEPEHDFSFRWVPYGIDADVDPANEPTTLRGGRAVGTEGQAGAEGCGIHAVAARPRQTTRRGPGRAGAPGAPGPAERQAGGAAKPRQVPRQSMVEFHLEPVAGGTLLSIVESGFDRVPERRRHRAFLMNEGGWSAQAENIRRHVESR